MKHLLWMVPGLILIAGCGSDQGSSDHQKASQSYEAKGVVVTIVPSKKHVKIQKCVLKGSFFLCLVSHSERLKEKKTY